MEKDMPEDQLDAYNIYDLRDLAKKRLPRLIFEFVDRGTEDEVALANNRAAFDRIKLKPRSLIDVSKRSQETTLFGKKQKMPIAIAPTGAAGLLWHEGELKLARAARDAGIPFTLATNSITPMEKVAKEAGGRLWFQLYMWENRAMSHELVNRAKDAGFEALIVTVDGVVSPNREYNKRNGYGVPFGFNRKNVTDVLMHPGWMTSVFLRYILTTGMPRRENLPAELRASIVEKPSSLKNDSLNWEDLKALRQMWPGTLMVKGILHPEDAVLAADCGADAVVISNHGGRNLDSSQAPIEVLPEVVNAVGNRVSVIVDSGFRRGADVVKALALGANAVLVGRSTLYGVAVGGEAGAARAIGIFREEISRMMAMIGCRSVEELGSQYLHLPPGMVVPVRGGGRD